MQAKLAWRGGNLAPADETQLLALFSSKFFPEDHAARAAWWFNFGFPANCANTARTCSNPSRRRNPEFRP